jgi:hypothetical protein
VASMAPSPPGVGLTEATAAPALPVSLW